MTRSRALAGGLLAACIGMTAFSIGALLVPGAELTDRPSFTEVLMFGTIFLTFPSVGFVVVAKRPNNPVGWLFLATGVSITMSVFAGEYAAWRLHSGFDLPGAPVVAWLGSWTWTASASIALPLALMLFPSGQLPGPRWRAPAAVGVAAGLLIALAIAIRPGVIVGYEGGHANPFGVGGPIGDGAAAVAEYETVALLYMTILAVSSLIVRMRRRGAERQQLKWLLFPTAIFVAALALAGVSQIVAGPEPAEGSPWATAADAAWSVVLLVLAAIPICAGIAILRHRLYDVDVVIRRTVVYTTVVGILGLVYVALVIALGSILQQATGGNTLAVGVSTLAIAVLFGPVRAAVRGVVDRRFYRSRYDAQRMSEAFAARLRDQVELEAVGQTLVTVAGEAVRPRSATVWIRERA